MSNDQTDTVSPRLSEAEISKIQARADAATPGPWSHDVMYVVAAVPTGRPGGEVIIQCRETVGRRLSNREANAEFVAHARSDVPRLLADLARTRAEADALTRERDDAVTALNDQLAALQTAIDRAKDFPCPACGHHLTVASTCETPPPAAPAAPSAEIESTVLRRAKSVLHEE